MMIFRDFPIRLLPLSLWGCLLLVPVTSLHAAAACPRADHKPKIVIQSNPGTVKYDTSRTRAQLASIRASQTTSSRANTSPGKDWFATGLTVATLEFNTSLKVQAKSQGKSRYCAYPVIIEATIGYNTINVYIAKRYKKGSCQYLTILEHENNHVAVFRRVLSNHGKKLRRDIEDAVRNLQPLLVSNPNQAAKKMNNALKRKTKPLFKQINLALDKANGKLDTKKNYLREQAKCSSW